MLLAKYKGMSTVGLAEVWARAMGISRIPPFCGAPPRWQRDRRFIQLLDLVSAIGLHQCASFFAGAANQMLPVDSV